MAVQPSPRCAASDWDVQCTLRYFGCEPREGRTRGRKQRQGPHLFAILTVPTLISGDKIIELVQFHTVLRQHTLAWCSLTCWVMWY